MPFERAYRRPLGRHEVVLTDNVPDDTSRLFVRAVITIAQFVHREENAPVNWLESITDIRECATDDNRHCIVEVGGTHLLFDVDRKRAWIYIRVRHDGGL